MPHIVMVDGMPVDVSNAETAATVVKNAITARDTANQAVTDSQAVITARDATIAGNDAEIATLKDQVSAAALTPQALRDAAASYARTVAQAKALGATITDAMDEGAIKAAVVAHKLADAAKNYTPEQVSAAFDVLASGVKDATAALADASDPLRAALTDGAPQSLGDAEQKFQDARQKRLDRLANGHLSHAKEG